MWRATVLTIFPEMFPGPLGLSLAGKALAAGLWTLDAVDIRAHATDKHRSVDDTPAGGRDRVHGAGEHVGAHHHAGSAAGGRVVDGAVLVGRVRADVDGFERPQAGRECLTREAYAERPRKHLGENGENGRAPHDAEQIPLSSPRGAPRDASVAGTPKAGTHIPEAVVMGPRLRGDDSV